MDNGPRPSDPEKPAKGATAHAPPDAGPSEPTPGVEPGECADADIPRESPGAYTDPQPTDLFEA